MISQKEDSQFVWFGISISLHLLILIGIFISLQNKPSLVHKPKEKRFAFKVPTPIVFYGQQMAPNKLPGSLSQANQPSPAPTQQQTTPKPQPPEKTQAPPVEKKPLAINQIKKETTLADIFNHARHNFNVPQKSNLQTPGDASGQPLVIREGDIRYYSLWSTFLTHLNNAARFNRMKKPAPLGEWIANKLVKNHIQCGITINKKGEVQDIDIILSSGHRPYDELCIMDIWSASPFPPLPNQLGKNVARFEVRTHI